MTTITDIFTRFIMTPRINYDNNTCYIQVFDKSKQDYIRNATTHKIMQFESSREIYWVITGILIQAENDKKPTNPVAEATDN